MVEAELLFHFDDSSQAETLIDVTTGELAFSLEEAEIVKDRVERLWDYDWSQYEHDDIEGSPFAYVLETHPHTGGRIQSGQSVEVFEMMDNMSKDAATALVTDILAKNRAN